MNKLNHVKVIITTMHNVNRNGDKEITNLLMNKYNLYKNKNELFC